ncbi:hypothetical protein [Ornithinimicrobium pratense]|uniref:ATP-grasp domain-containing protein n=1 Tax=Ornithinimicrobium pratense TaxID=2593973 RepID=A0A5J6V382_9MICO|nr:hypothetical protein [Ornithinimicrobium pratense]QFG67632.1 hypothetical protein FY030_01830 [Ornithinimicrobium pratense]
MTSPARAGSTGAAAAPFHPVLLGTDQGIYALARAFHESYGVRSTIVARAVTGGIAWSRIADVVELTPDGGRDEVISTLLARGRMLREQSPSVPLLLLCNADSHAQLFAEHAEELGELYVFPYLSEQTLAQVADKTHFAQICERLGLATPRTSVISFAGADEPGWAPDPVQVPFPVVAKPDNGASYENLRFPGYRKIWFLDTPEEWAQLARTLAEAGYRDDFLVQELIPGDDTHQLSVVAYVDQHGTVTAMATAQVLLGEHHPMALGNPAAMITTPMSELMDAAERILGEVDYWGFANIDAKIDPRTGTTCFMEMNPRMGRNNYYATAAGADIVGAVVDDVVHGLQRAPRRGMREILYCIVSPLMLLHYVRDPQLRRRVLAAARRRTVHPLLYERLNLRRRAYVLVQQANHVRKFARYYPRPTASGF